MKRILCLIIMLSITFSLCSCGKSREVGENVYNAVSVACDAYLDNISIKAIEHEYDNLNIRYSINRITESDNGKNYVVDITWYVNFIDSTRVESYWNQEWFYKLSQALLFVEIDGHTISHTNREYRDLISVVINNGEPYNGIDYSKEKGNK